MFEVAALGRPGRGDANDLVHRSTGMTRRSCDVVFIVLYNESKLNLPIHSRVKVAFTPTRLIHVKHAIGEGRGLQL